MKPLPGSGGPTVSHFSLLSILLLLASLAAARGAETNRPSARPFAHPDRIRYDARCLTIDGRDVFIYSGSFHYFRCPKALWHDRFQKIKEAGFNAVETYVPWNWSEREMPSGLDDFSKVNLKDLDDFLTMAESFGLYAIARPGPYICAEWDTGGYPQWLLTKKPAAPLRSQGWLRSDDPVYLAWCRHWYNAVCPVIARHQITRKPPGKPGVILVQVENEYDYASFPDAAKINQVKTLAEAALASGIDVPLITCWTHQVRGQTDPILRQIFDCCNFYPRWNVNSIQNNIEKLRREQPDAPLGTTELQGGWFSQVGGKPSEDQDGINAAQINNLTLFTIQNGETFLNYYMLFGGTNPGDWAARNLTTTYDYNAPIREWGGVGDRYQRVWAIGHMLQEHGARLARSQEVACEVSTSQKDVTVVMRRAQDGSRYLFVRTSQHTEPRDGTARVKEKDSDAPEIVFDYHLEPFGSKVLYLAPGTNDAARGEWLPKQAPAIERPTDLPSGVTISSALTREDPGPVHWTKLSPGEDLAQAGIYDSRFIFYRAAVDSDTATNLLVEYPSGDGVLAAVGGRPLACIGNGSGRSVFAVPAGSSDLRLLYENLGHANGGTAMEHLCGILGARLSASALAVGKAIEGWRMHEVEGTSHRPEIRTDFDDADWTSVDVNRLEADNLPSNRTAVYRAAVELSAPDLKAGKMKLDIGRIDDLGWIYVNGDEVGKTTDWSREYSFDVTSNLHPGRNVIAIIVRNNDGAGGLGEPSLGQEAAQAAVPLEAFGSPAGVEEQWWQPGLPDGQWKSVTIGNERGSAQNDAQLTWYRLKFALPTVKPGVWVPWRLHLEAAGNGFLYLNGHALGRYWQAGPQHDFFLPDCWLHFGGSENVLAMNLRPIDKGASIQSAAVEPYAGFAEKR